MEEKEPGLTRVEKGKEKRDPYVSGALATWSYLKEGGPDVRSDRTGRGI